MTILGAGKRPTPPEAMPVWMPWQRESFPLNHDDQRTMRYQRQAEERFFKKLLVTAIKSIGSLNLTRMGGVPLRCAIAPPETGFFPQNPVSSVGNTRNQVFRKKPGFS
jgi:hypothetical protein